jgi:hypothetical protein
VGGLSAGAGFARAVALCPTIACDDFGVGLVELSLCVCCCMSDIG